MSDSAADPVLPGHIRCFLTGKLRLDTPEEHVRQRWARSLVNEYRYPKADLEIMVWIRMGSHRKRADLAIYRHGAPHVQDHILTIVKTNRDSRKSTDSLRGEGNLKNFMAACGTCRFGLWIGEERLAFEKLPNGAYEQVTDIPRFGAEKPPPLPTRDALKAEHDLKPIFRRCHNFIYAKSGLRQDQAFHELVKLIFCKTFDEEESGTSLQFAVLPREKRTDSGRWRLMEERLGPLFQNVKERHTSIFADDTRIRLKPEVVADVVAELQYISLLDTDADVKGAAYEELVGDDLRGGRGQYFTPRNVCNMAVRMAMALYEEHDLASLNVLDCCCGTGGFLVSWLNNLYAVLLNQENIRSRTERRPEEMARERVRKVCHNRMFGLDICPDLVRACQMNMIMHGDGSSNIYEADSTRSPGEWDGNARDHIPYGDIDVLITNPPFGSSAQINDEHVLGQYELPGWESRNTRSSLPAEQLFVETSMRFLKPGGHLVIVLPDSILNNPGLRFIRSWLLHRSKIMASIDLPKTTFAASEGINNPSVLIVQRLAPQKATLADSGVIDKDYNMFMATPQTSGTNARSKPVFLRHPDGREIFDGDGNRIINDQISLVPKAFDEWLKSNT